MVFSLLQIKLCALLKGYLNRTIDWYTVYLQKTIGYYQLNITLKSCHAVNGIKPLLFNTQC